MIRITFLACLLWVSADGFGIPVPFIQPSLSIKFQSEYAQRSRTSRTSPWPRFGAISSDPKTPESSVKVREMAAFLASQLFEKALKEATKDEKDSKFSMNDVVQLADTLQNISKTSEAQTKLEPTWTAAGQAVKEKLCEENLSERAAVEPLIAEPKQEESEDSMTGDAEDEIQTTQDEADVEVPAGIVNDEEEKEESSSIPELESEVAQISEKKEEDFDEKDEIVAEKPPVVPAPASSGVETVAVSSTEGVPDLISKEFGRPLEIVTSGLPPLREASIPKRKALEQSVPAVAAIENAASETASITATTMTEESQAPSTEVAEAADDSNSEDVSSQPATESTIDEKTEEVSSVENAAVAKEEDVSSTEEEQSLAPTEIVDSPQPSKDFKEIKEEGDILQVGVGTDPVEDVIEDSSIPEVLSTDSFAATRDEAGTADKVVLDETLTDSEFQPSEQTVESNDDKNALASVISEVNAMESTEEPAPLETPAEEALSTDSTAVTIDKTETDDKVVLDETSTDSEAQPSEQAVESSDDEKNTPVGALGEVNAVESSEELATLETPTETKAVVTKTEEAVSKKGKNLQRIQNFFFRNQVPPPLTEYDSSPLDEADDSSNPPKLNSEESIKKAPETEAEIASKYGSMSLEDRSFAILSDLGMLQEMKSNASGDDGMVLDSTASDESIEFKEAAPEDTNEGSESNIAETPSIDVSEQSETNEPKINTSGTETSRGDAPREFKRKRLLEPIRSFLSQPRSVVPFLSTRAPSGARAKEILQARQQPKSLEEEALLASKYGSMEFEERAFAILYDLGMIESHVDPSDPSYDDSNDDEYCD